MINRYNFREILKNESEIYETVLREKNIKFIEHYETPVFSFANSQQIKRLQITRHAWTVGDKFYKLANTYYGDSKDWWIIAKFNNTPTESHVKIGDIILIPKPLTLVLEFMKG